MGKLPLIATAVVAALAAGGGARAAPASAQDPGKRVFDHWCAACHAPNARAPGTASLAVKYGAARPAALEQRTDLTPDTVRFFVRTGVSVMPSFRKTEITDAELDALGAYLSHAAPGATK